MNFVVTLSMSCLLAGPAVVPPRRPSSHRGGPRFARDTAGSVLRAGGRGSGTTSPATYCFSAGQTHLPLWQSLFVFFWLVGAGQAQAVERLRVVIHVHTTVSTGVMTPQQVMEQAEKEGLDGVIFTDSLRRRWEYGVRPLRAVIKKRVEQPSVLQLGAAAYIERIRALAGGPLFALAGVEAAPFYYWRRSPFDRRGGEIRNWNQHLLVLGIHDPNKLAQLPLDSYDPYHGEEGAAPYQVFIDAAAAAGGLVFWAHPEVSHEGSHGGVFDYTAAYPHWVEETTGHDGFAVTYLGYFDMVQPGGAWDRLLTGYCEGRRKKPAWVIGESDWRSPQERPLAMAVTEVLVEQRSAQGLLDALRGGHAWAVIRGSAAGAQLSDYSVVDHASGKVAISGDHISLKGRLVVIRTSGTRDAAAAGSFRLTVVKNGKVLHAEQLSDRKFQRQWVDEAPDGRSYYRLILEDGNTVYFTNPIFVRRQSA